MRKIKPHILPLLLLLLPLFIAVDLSAASLSLDNDYRIRGILYTNNDFNDATSTDAVAYYSQRLHLTLTGKFNDGIEICTRISAIGVVGSTNVYTGLSNSTDTVVSPPYHTVGFVPFIDYAYITLNNFAGLSVDVIAGKQPLTYGNGLIVSDNGTGINAFRFCTKYELPLPVPTFHLFKGPLWYTLPVPMQTEFFTAKLAEGLRPGYDLDLYGIVNQLNIKKYHIEFSLFQESDGSGTRYIKGVNAYDTSFINKSFYDLYVTRKEDISNFRFEIAKETGFVRRPDGEKISISGLGYNLYGELIGDKTKLGKVAAHAQIAFNTGDNNPGLFADDGSFNPSQTRRFDGLERVGYGELYAASPYDAFFPFPSSYSGLDTLNLGIDFSPVYGWNMGLDYFYFSSSQGPDGAPAASGFERLYGAEFALGVEMDLYVKYVYSKYTEMRFSYNRYTPPKFDVFWPKSDPATRYQLEISAKF